MTNSHTSVPHPSELKFWEFHQNNPNLYELFKQFTFQVIQLGRDHYSADAILHRIRWETDMASKDDKGFKINNNYQAYYARLFMRDHPAHRGFFRTCVMKTGCTFYEE